MSATTSSSGGTYGRASVPPGRTPSAPVSGVPVSGAPSGTRISGRAHVPGARGESGPARGVGRVGGPGGPGGPRRPGAPYRRGPQPKWGRIALVAVAALALLGLLGAGGTWIYVRSLNGNIGRTDAFADLTNGRPPKTASGALNILMVGTDSRDPDAALDKAGKWRADTIIVMHIPASQDKAYLVSIPRDLYVPVPKSAKSDCSDSERHKVNSAFAFGGLPLAVRTVECFTDVRMDHVMAIDFAGFKEVTDALGGVDLNVEQTIKSIHKPFRTFQKGVNHMNGEEALDWVRQRKQFPEGDFARMRHQQDFLRALMDKAASTGTLTNPGKLNSFLKAVTNAVTVDESFSLVDMALQFRNLRGDNLKFLTSPYSGSQTIGGESVVVSDKNKALAMYKAMSDDKMAEWATANKK
ncbi:cell envelope-related function transcriptional attenuator common domain-containing protein [Asanoa hainanensis]|uniref:Cell envelope-related function transcriptional attenuator common domain-containing protein n=1 Tax=Asanoa hainanensis TaxID=560556 RepID=A0A239MU70_9ACTN|nr:LCP family protein [Asanoa hainanensis]SNT46205.1 cell envelope-related function transcriptional attenuator common domain-containing protein [Asanoa hainanensis]